MAIILSHISISCDVIFHSNAVKFHTLFRYTLPHNISKGQQKILRKTYFLSKIKNGDFVREQQLELLKKLTNFTIPHNLSL